MDRRRKLMTPGLLALLLGAGCKTMTDSGPPPAALPGAGPAAQAFDPSKPPVGVPYSAAQPREYKKGDPLKPDTQAILGDVDYQSALEQTSTVNRDHLLDSARQKYQAALKTDPKHLGASVGLARLYAATGDKQAAVQTMQTLCQHHPHRHDLTHKLATIEFQFGDYASAERNCQLALQGDPKNRLYLKTYALCQAHTDEWDAAFGTLVNTQIMTQAQARYFLGRTLLDLGRPDEAKAQMAEALRLEPDHQYAAKTLADLTQPREVGDPNGVVNAGHQHPPTR